jgi:hypothetical protein
VTDPAQLDAQGKSSLWLAFRVFDEPTAVFKQLAEKPRALVPILCLILSASFSALALPSRVMEEQARTTFEPLQESGRMTAEDAQERIENASGTIARVTVLGAGAVGGPLFLVVAAWVLMLIFGATTADPLRFKDEFAIVSHAYMISIAGGVLTVALLAFAGLDEVLLSLGFLFDVDSSPFLHRFTNQITVFGAWNVYVLALGNQVKTKAKGIGGALTIVGGLWLAMKVVGALMIGFFTGLGS